jgi:translation initiation factor 2-alpha kinase 3
MTKPQLAVHMQMALYPMTLTDFLYPDKPAGTATAPPLKHCFHLKPSIRILLAIIDGIAYLHQNQIVHRDLKPGNIFLAPGSNPRVADGSVDLSLCDDCDKADPVSLKVRIGDFGLVTALATAEHAASCEGPESCKPPVGTELYRPPDGVRGTASPALDIYAAGIVAVELLCPFGTRESPFGVKRFDGVMLIPFTGMERHETLHSLKCGRFPAGFSERIGDAGGALERCVREMLRPDHPPIEELRRRLLAIL